MKRWIGFVGVIAILTGNTGYAQGILNNGAFIVMNGAAQIYVAGGTNGDYLSQANGRITPSASGIITIEGDWTNNAGNTGFTADAGTVVLNGAAQSINGTSVTTFYNLTLQGTNTKTLNISTNVGGVTTTNGVLSLGTRPLALNSNTLTITNPTNAAVFFSTGHVVSETNFSPNPSIMRWNTGAFATTYTFPFGTVAGVGIPFNVGKTTATAVQLSVSTRPTAGSNNVPWAAGVTHMFDPNLNQDGSDEAVIDRWWELNASVPIVANLGFMYLGTENTLIAPFNTGNIGAQYWSTAWLPDNSTLGSTPAVLAGVGTHTAAGVTVASTFTPWVLSSVLAPLPVELVRFESACTGNSVALSWTTASENNNAFFTLQRSDDGLNYRDIAVIAGAGTTSQMTSYSYMDNDPIQTVNVYYRLKQTDVNGYSTYSNVIVQSDCGQDVGNISVFGIGNEFVVSIFSEKEEQYNVTLYDAAGKRVYRESIDALEGQNRRMFSSIIPATGIYFVVVEGGSGQLFSQRLYMTR